MLVPGVTGGCHDVQEDCYSLPTDAAHAAAAVLLEDVDRVACYRWSERLVVLHPA